MTDEDQAKKERFQQQLCDLIATALAEEFCPGCLAQVLVKLSVAICRWAELTPEQLDGHGFGFMAVAETIKPSQMTTLPSGATPRQ
jgi:hypothetical protein